MFQAASVVYLLLALLHATPPHVGAFAWGLCSRRLCSHRPPRGAAGAGGTEGGGLIPGRHSTALRRSASILRAAAITEKPPGAGIPSAPSAQEDAAKEASRPLRPMDIHRRMAEQRAMEEAANPDHRSPDIPLRLHRLQDLILTRVDVDVRNDPGDRERMQEFLGMLAEEAPDPKVGDILTGPVSCTNDRGVYLDVPGLSLPAFMPWSEVSLLPLDNPRESFPEGQVVSAKVIALDKFPVVSLRIAEFRAAWQRLVGVHGAGGVVDVTVTDVNRGGALCACHGLRGFIPSSHFIGTPDPSHIGKQYKAKILQIDAPRQQVQFSLRQALMADFVAANGTVVKSAYRPGSLLSGTVSGITDFGVFLNLEGGGSGLLHRSSISAMPIPRLSDVFRVNQTLKVVIQSLDPATGRCGLETKSLERRPGDIADNITRAMETAEETFNMKTANGTILAAPSAGRHAYVRGDLVQGRVSGIASYGAFVTLPGGASGLLHKADMSSEAAADGAFPEGIALDSELTAVVDAVNATSGRLRLSLRPLERYPGEARHNFTAMMAEAAAAMGTKRFGRPPQPSDSSMGSGASGSSSSGGSSGGSRYRQSKERLLAGSLRTMTSNPFDSRTATSAPAVPSAASASGSSGSGMPWKEDFIAKILRQINIESSSSSSTSSSSPRPRTADPSEPDGADGETAGAATARSGQAASEGGGAAPANMDSLLASIQESIESEILVDGDAGAGILDSVDAEAGAALDLGGEEEPPDAEVVESEGPGGDGGDQ